MCEGAVDDTPKIFNKGRGVLETRNDVVLVFLYFSDTPKLFSDTPKFLNRAPKFSHTRLRQNFDLLVADKALSLKIGYSVTQNLSPKQNSCHRKLPPFGAHDCNYFSDRHVILCHCLLHLVTTVPKACHHWCFFL